MFFRQIQADGLAHHSYFIGQQNEAIVIDPRRDIDIYLDLARQGGFRIKKILETHRNEDYVIGSVPLQEFTGAEILHGPGLDWGYGTTIKDGERFGFGGLEITALTTPGHTPESLTFSLADLKFSDQPILAFTGDALFIGDSGRTDLWPEKTSAEAADILYDSIMRKIIPLGDHVLLYPAHGSGSVCGGAIAERDLSSLGYEKRFNPSMTGELAQKDHFVERKAQEKHLGPSYFKLMEQWNLTGEAPRSYPHPEITPLTVDEFAEQQDRGALTIDLRMPQAFAGAHIPQSLNVWFGGLSSYLPWVSAVDQDLLFVLPDGVDVGQLSRQLYRIGYDHAQGYLVGGVDSWQNSGRELGQLKTIDSLTLAKERKRNQNLTVLDVRPDSEWEAGSIEGAKHIFLGDLHRHLDELPKDQPIVSMCSVGQRGGIGASILARHGFPNVMNYLGGYKAWQKQTS